MSEPVVKPGRNAVVQIALMVTIAVGLVAAGWMMCMMLCRM